MPHCGGVLARDRRAAGRAAAARGRRGDRARPGRPPVAPDPALGWHSIVLTPLVDVAARPPVGGPAKAQPRARALAGLVLGIGAHVYLARGPRASRRAALRSGPRPTMVVRPRSARFPLRGLPAGGRTHLSRGKAGRFTSPRAPQRRPRWPMSRTRCCSLAAAADCAGGAPARARPGRLVRPAEPLAPAGSWNPFSLPGPGAGVSARRAVGTRCSTREPLWRRPWRQSGHPNGFDNLTTITAVAASAGVLQLVALASSSTGVPPPLSSIGLRISGALGAGRWLLVWPEHWATSTASTGGHVAGRAAARWQSQPASVEKKPADPTSPSTRCRYRLDAEAPPSVEGAVPDASRRAPGRRRFRENVRVDRACDPGVATGQSSRTRGRIVNAAAAHTGRGCGCRSGRALSPCRLHPRDTAGPRRRALGRCTVSPWRSWSPPWEPAPRQPR
jgi:hypothetical protein